MKIIGIAQPLPAMMLMQQRFIDLYEYNFHTFCLDDDAVREHFDCEETFITLYKILHGLHSIQARHGKEIILADYAGEFDMKPQTFDKRIKPLVKKGILKKTLLGTGKKLKCLLITDKGHAVLNAFHGVDDKILKKFPEEIMDDLYHSLENLTNHFPK